MHIRPEEFQVGNHGPGTLPPGPGGPEPTSPVSARPQRKASQPAFSLAGGRGDMLREALSHLHRGHICTSHSFLTHLLPHSLVCPVFHPTIIYGALTVSRGSRGQEEAVGGAGRAGGTT